jgi:hypothetical protein
MSKPFKSKRATLWLAGISLLVLGFLVAFVVLPLTSLTPGADGPDVRVPSMENVPSEHAPRMKLDVEKKQE